MAPASAYAPTALRIHVPTNGAAVVRHTGKKIVVSTSTSYRGMRTDEHKVNLIMIQAWRLIWIKPYLLLVTRAWMKKMKGNIVDNDQNITLILLQHRYHDIFKDLYHYDESNFLFLCNSHMSHT